MFVFQLSDATAQRGPITVDSDTTVGELVDWFQATPGLSGEAALKWAGRVVQAVCVQNGAARAQLDEAGYTLVPTGS